jgi:hypothetical protein
VLCVDAPTLSVIAVPGVSDVTGVNVAAVAVTKATALPGGIRGKQQG